MLIDEGREALPPFDFDPSKIRELFLYPGGTEAGAAVARKAWDCRERQLLEALSTLSATQRELEEAKQLQADTETNYLLTNQHLVKGMAVLDGRLAEAKSELSTTQREREELKAALAAMTEDRNLWQGEHNEDCPNLSSLASIRHEVLLAEEKIDQYLQGQGPGTVRLGIALQACRRAILLLPESKV
jgi:hypothetical protein